MPAVEPITPTPDTGGEDLVVLRLEGLGAFAVPVTVLDGFRVPEAPPADGVRAAGEGGIATGAGFRAVPLILDGDFMRATTGRRRELVVDRLGCVGPIGHAARAPGSDRAGGGRIPGPTAG